MTYQGISILEPPLRVQVSPMDDPFASCDFSSGSIPVCDPDLLWRETGRWHAIDGAYYTPDVPKMDWFPAKCRLKDQDEAQDLQEEISEGRGMNVFTILIGDSLMGLQHQNWQQQYREWPSVHISMHGGMAERLDPVIHAVDAHLPLEAKLGNKVLVLFNSGLHDFHYCKANEVMDCVGLYAENMAKVIKTLKRWQSQGVYVAYRTTTASFQRWGNVWAAKHNGYNAINQSFCESHHVIEEQIRLHLDDVVSAGIPIIDGYNTTLTRADHAEKDNRFTAYVHFGPEVPALHNRIFVLMAAKHLSSLPQEASSANHSVVRGSGVKAIEGALKAYWHLPLAEFVHAAYKIVLGRRADDEGLRVYSAMLREEKISRKDLVHILRESAEGVTWRKQEGRLPYLLVAARRSLPARTAWSPRNVPGLGRSAPTMNASTAAAALSENQG